MNIQHLRYALEVAKTGSITQAAENLFMGQPNLSKAIRELENGLHIRLFRRSSRGVIPTPEGEEFLQYARGIITQVDKVESLYRPDRSTQIRYCLYAMPSIYISELFSRFCARLNANYPDAKLRLSLKEAPRQAVIEAVADSICDAGLFRCRLDEEVALISLLNRKELDYKIVDHYRYHLLMSKHHPLASVPVITKEMLIPYPRVHLESTLEETPCLFESELSTPLHSQGSIIVSGRDSVLLLLERMHDAYITASPLPASLLERHHLVARQASGDIVHYRYFFITRRNSTSTRFENLLIDEMDEMLK
ncbi:MAG: LysR family transcriptional regulator [Clostridia bacterium]|nr:LysR family transcriptional regulator [Clostridia bacterium]